MVSVGERLEKDGRRLEVLLAGPRTVPAHYIETDRLTAITGLPRERIEQALATRVQAGRVEYDSRRGWRRLR